MNLKASAAHIPLPTLINGTDRIYAPRRCRNYEPDAWAALMPHAKPGTTFVDVGANIGLYAIAAAKRGAKAVAIEPDRRNIRQLRALAALNRTPLTIIQAMAGATNGAATLAERGNAESSGHVMHNNHKTRYVVAPVITLDSVHPSPINTLKIDVEGGELDVLRGAHNTLEAGVGALMVEVHPAALEQAGETVAALADLLTDHGYNWTVLPVSPGDLHERWIASR